MNRLLVWIVGRGGLLGKHLQLSCARQFSHFTEWRSPISKFSWNDPDALEEQFALATSALADAARSHDACWSVLWAAGSCVVGSSKQELDAESSTWSTFLSHLGKRVICQTDAPGVVFLASSAGGVYGNSPALPITEDSPCVPISAYGQGKLQQEQLLAEWARNQPNVVCLVGRISNIYGPGHNPHKTQGLISHISLSLIHNRPVHIYVPLDTIRDYIYAEDCAQQILASIKRLAADHRPDLRTKIFASESETTLAHIVSIFSRLQRRHIRVICAPDQLSLQQPWRLMYRSRVWSEIGQATVRTTLESGIGRVVASHLEQFRLGRLPAT